MPHKTVLISGATAGIGKETARQIAAHDDSRVVIIGRDEAKCQQVIDTLKTETGNDQLDYLVADLSSIEDTRAVAQAYKDRYDRLDVLVNNVGALFTSRRESVDGFEMTFALNHLIGYFLLTLELLDVLKASAPARIVTVSSDSHYQGQLNFDDLEFTERNYNAFQAYSDSKLMNVLFAFELARRLEGTDVTSNVLHPGLVATNFGLTNNRGGLRELIIRGIRTLANIFSISEAQGAQTSVYLATSPEVADVTGQYFEDSQPKRAKNDAYDRQQQERLWAISQEKLGLGEPVQA